LKLTQSPNENIRQVVLETLSRKQANIIAMILLGSCGYLGFAALVDAAHLLKSVVTCIAPTEQLRSDAVNLLKTEQFRLGDDARQVVLNAIEGVVRNEVQIEGLQTLLEQTWELHQMDDAEDLETTDVVHRFIKQFSR